MNGRQMVPYMGASILLLEKTLSVMPLCVMPPPPKGGGFCEELPLRGKTSPGRGKMSRSDKRGNLASAVTERVFVFTHTHPILSENAP